MNLYDIDNLKRDVAQNNLYNLFDATFKYLTNVTLYQYQVQKFQEMRIDLVSNDIYKDTQYCDFLLNLNNIDLPLNILEGDILLYVKQEQIQYFHLDETTAKTLRNTYLNSSKISKQDPNRVSYIQNNYALPVTFLDFPIDSVQISDGKIILGNS